MRLIILATGHGVWVGGKARGGAAASRQGS
jgi:hypothetical protein